MSSSYLNLVPSFIDLNPPVIFRGGDIPMPQHGTDYLNPGANFTDNPERARRITQLSTTAQFLYKEYKAVDDELTKYDLRGTLDDMLKRGGHPTSKSFLEIEGKLLPEDKRKEWDKALENFQTYDLWLDLLAMFTGAFGANKAWVWLGLPEQATIRELGSATFLKREMIVTKSLWASARNAVGKLAGGRGIVPEMPAFQPLKSAQGLTELETMEAQAASVKEFNVLTATRVRVAAAETEVALGGRIFARAAGFAAEAAGGLLSMAAAEVAMQAYYKHDYINSEHEASVTRLANQRTFLVFAAVKSLISDIQTAHSLTKDAEAQSDPRFKEHDREKAREKCTTIGNDLLEKLKKVTYEDAYDVLHQDDVRWSAYMNDDLSKEELIKRTIQTIKDLVDAPPMPVMPMVVEA